VSVDDENETRGPGFQVADTLDFEDVAVGEGEVSQILRIANSGPEPLSITNISWSQPDADLSFTSECSAPVEPFNTCGIVVQFAPGTIRGYEAELTIEAEGLNPKLVRVLGNGVEQV